MYNWLLPATDTLTWKIHYGVHSRIWNDGREDSKLYGKDVFLHSCGNSLLGRHVSLQHWIHSKFPDDNVENFQKISIQHIQGWVLSWKSWKWVFIFALITSTVDHSYMKHACIVVARQEKMYVLNSSFEPFKAYLIHGITKIRFKNI